MSEVQVFYDLPFEDYMKLEGISNGGLSQFKKSPSNYKWSMKCPQQGEVDSLVIGSAEHVLVLEGQEAFYAEFIVEPKVDKRSKEGKQAYSDFLENSKGKTVISDSDFDKITKMFESLNANEEALNLLEGTKREVSVVWVDESTGLKCKARFDAVDFERGLCIDLKTTAKIYDLPNSVESFGYHRQQAHYMEAFKAVTGEYPLMFSFIFIGKTLNLGKYPTLVTVLDEEFITHGQYERELLMQRMATCKKDNDFSEIAVISPTRWQFK